MFKINKGIAVLAALAFMGAASASQAQTAIGQANSTSGAQANSGSQSQSSSGVVFNTPSRVTSTTNSNQSGSSTLKTAPGLGGLALGGGHPCAYSPATGQFSVIGGGAGFGGMKVDSACLLLIQAAAFRDPQAYNAAMNMIAMRDPDACKAMYMAGMVSDCVDKNGKSTVRAPVATTSSSTRSAVPASAATPKLYSKCYLDQDSNQIKVTFTSAGRKDKTNAAMACQRALGF